MDSSSQQQRAEQEKLLVLRWLLFVLVLAFLLWLPVTEGVASEFFRRDPTRITLIIGLLFLGGMIHIGFRVFALSKEQERLAGLIENAGKLRVADGHFYCQGAPVKSSPVSDYFRDLLTQSQSRENSGSRLDEILADKIRGQHEAGWFLTGMLIKLGLLGTVVGFILMLASVSDISSLQLSQMQQVLTKMAVGIGVALNTTLLGLLGSMVLGMQYLMLDRTADQLLASAAHFAQMRFSSHTD